MISMNRQNHTFYLDIFPCLSSVFLFTSHLQIKSLSLETFSKFRQKSLFLSRHFPYLSSVFLFPATDKISLSLGTFSKYRQNHYFIPDISMSGHVFTDASLQQTQSLKFYKCFPYIGKVTVSFYTFIKLGQCLFIDASHLQTKLLNFYRWFPGIEKLAVLWEASQA